MLLVGLPQRFAIESATTQAYERPSLMALGYFILHIGGHSYGVKKPDASMLACSFDEARARISRRGSHLAHDLQKLDATVLADRFVRSYFKGEIVADKVSDKTFLDTLYQSHIVWAPDGDEAFDDGSYVFQFDIGDDVRLIAFRDDGHTVVDVIDIRLPEDEYYSILFRWAAAFEDEWRRSDKY